ncbi:MAG: beta-galactosidase, partial [Firmicutes bacterium]|nr:beta-galactosidase [Candidatus Colimorpha enterica]
YREVITRLKPYLCTNGGPIIMLQIENEYGSYGDDKEYLYAVANMYREYGADCMLYTSDGPTYGMFNGGTLPEYPCVANFGSHPENAFKVLDEFRPDQPSMCGEFWCGWFDHWGDEHHVRTAEDMMKDVQPMIDCGASFNFYMFHGGTKFGFTNGANYDGTYEPTVTSYDYCSPVSENGDMTENYFAIREALSKVTDIPEIEVSNLPRKDYGEMKVSGYAPLFDNLSIGTKVHSAAPKLMEEVGQDFGYILYSTVLTGPLEERSIIVENVHDRALVYINGEFKGIIDRFGREDRIRIKLGFGEKARVDVLVENCGRVNYGRYLFDRKGALGGIRLGGMFHFGWDSISLTMDDLSGVNYSEEKPAKNTPVFIKGSIDVEGKPADTFVRTEGLHKGFITVNGFNLGRYWNDSKPQKTLFVPAPILHEGKNEVVIFESDSCEDFRVTFEDKPDLG